MATLRLATFNIRNGRAFDGCNSWPFRRGVLRDSVRQLDADLIGLQEVYGFQRRWLLAGMPGHAAYGLGRGRSDRGEQCPLLLRRGTWQVESRTTRWFGPEPGRPGQRLPGARFPRIATIAALRSPDGAAAFQVANVHLDAHSAELRRVAVEQLLTWMDADQARLVIGDLNAPVGDTLLDLLVESGLRSVLPEGAGGSDHRFSGRTDGPRIDHIYVSSHFEVLHAEVVHRPTSPPYPSDHWPVLADLRLPADRTA